MYTQQIETDGMMRRIHQIGLEAEGWAPEVPPEELPIVSGGNRTMDAGVCLHESITLPQSSIDENFRILEKMQEQFHLFMSPFRPPIYHLWSGCWQRKEAYAARVEALRREKPGGYRWLIDNMPDFASFQVNVGGAFDAFSDEATFIIDFFNDVAPITAAQVHRELGFGYGHLKLWQKFAREERFPQAGRWFGSGVKMVQYIESVPRLVKKVCGRFVLNPYERQQVQNETDLSVMWWLVRPKRSEYGTYLEIRFLPSMPLFEARQYTELVVNLVEELLEWYNGANRGQAVVSIEAARPAYRLLSGVFPQYVPSAPVDDRVWQQCFNAG